MTDDGEFRAQLTMMYQAAKVEFPKYASMVSDCAEQLSQSLSIYEDQLGPTLDSPPLSDAVAMNRECYNLMRRAVIFLDHGAEALNFAAHQFEKTDEAAATASHDLAALINKPVPTVYVPPPLDGGDS